MNNEYKKIKHVALAALAALAAVTLAACSSGGGSSSADVGGENANSDNPNVVNGFDLSTAELVLTGPDVVGTGSRSNFTATLLNSNGIAPESPPGIPVEFAVSSGSTNPPDSDNTDANGEVNFQFRAPNNGTETVMRARIRNRDGEFVINEGVTITVQQNLFRFNGPPENTQVRLGQARQLRFDWRIGNAGATTGTQNQGNPTAVRLTLSGRPAGGGFRLGGAGGVSDPVFVNVVDGEFAQDVEVIAGDAGGPVDIVATASTDSQSLNAVLPIEFVGEPTRIEASPTNISVAPQGAELLTVRVFDENNTPLSDIPLRFSISICIDGQRDTTTCSNSGEQITRVSRTTDSNGEATTGFVAGNSTGGGEIEITVDSGAGNGLQRAIVYNVSNAAGGGGTGGSTGGGTTTPPAAASQSFSTPASGTQIPVNQTQAVVFNVRDANGDPSAGESVTFSLSRGLIDDDPNAPPAPANNRTFVTDASGNIRFNISSSTAGTATLSTGTTTLPVEFVSAATTINVSSEFGTIGPGNTNTITATVQDSNGAPLPGVLLQFFIDLDPSGGSRSPTSATTDAQGQATTVFTAGSGGTGDVVIRAANQGATNNGTVAFRVAAPGGGSTNSGASFTFVNNNGQFLLNQGNAISFNLEGGAPAANQQVTISTTLGQVDDDLNNPPAAASSRTFTTNGAGDINFVAISDTRGPATITASGPNGASATVDVEFIGTPDSISVTPTNQTLNTNAQQVITATVLDSSNTPVQGVTVTFRVDNDSSGGSRTPETAVTNAQGQASTTYTAGANTGNVTIRSTADGERLNANTVFDVTAPGSARAASFTAPQSGQEFDINTAVPGTFNLSSNGNPQANEAVEITISGGVIDDNFNAPPAASTARTFTTDGAGNIQFQIMSDQPGAFSLGVAGPDFGTGLSGRFVARPSNISAQAAPNTLGPNQSGTVTVTVNDNAGNPVAQRTAVNFQIISDGSGGATITPPPDSRTSQGTITADFVAGPNTGTVQINATAPTSGLSDNVVITVQ